MDEEIIVHQITAIGRHASSVLEFGSNIPPDVTDALFLLQRNCDDLRTIFHTRCSRVPDGDGSTGAAICLLLCSVLVLRPLILGYQHTRQSRMNMMNGMAQAEADSNLKSLCEKYATIPFPRLLSEASSHQAGSIKTPNASSTSSSSNMRENNISLKHPARSPRRRLGLQALFHSASTEYQAQNQALPAYSPLSAKSANVAAELPGSSFSYVSAITGTRCELPAAASSRVMLDEIEKIKATGDSRVREIEKLLAEALHRCQELDGGSHEVVKPNARLQKSSRWAGMYSTELDAGQESTKNNQTITKVHEVDGHAWKKGLRANPAELEGSWGFHTPFMCELDGGGNSVQFASR